MIRGGLVEDQNEPPSVGFDSAATGTGSDRQPWENMLPVEEWE